MHRQTFDQPQSDSLPPEQHSSAADSTNLLSDVLTSVPLDAVPDTFLRQKALSSARQGEYALAIALLDQLIDRNPVDASHYNNRGLVHFRNRQFYQALDDYDQAIALDPTLGQAYNNRANCHAAMGNLEAALADYEQAIDWNPTNVNALLNQGITLRDLRHYDLALESLDWALQMWGLLRQSGTPISETLAGHIYAERGRTYYLQGDWNCAVADYQRSLGILPQTEDEAEEVVSYRLRARVGRWLSQLLGPSYDPSQSSSHP